jgi:AcrR family transcriptional regulator
MKLSKGEVTRNHIVDQSRKIFNKEGVLLTLTELASRLEVTIGRITNHFPTKEHLFVGLAGDYEEKYAALMKSFSWEDDFSFTRLSMLVSKLMDLQYEHRCVMIFSASAGLNKTVMTEQISLSWNNNLKGFRILIETLVYQGLLDERVLQEDHYLILKFQHINLFTTWLVSYTLYDRARSYKKMKPTYFKGIMMVFFEYATPKGKQQLLDIGV